VTNQNFFAKKNVPLFRKTLSYLSAGRCAALWFDGFRALRRALSAAFGPSLME